MTRHHYYFHALFASLALALLTALPVRGQDEPPAGGTPAPKKAPEKEKAPADKADKKAPAGKAADKGADAKAGEPAKPDQGPAYEAPDPAVETILASDPKTPAQLTQGVISLLQLDKPDLAKPWIHRLLAAKPDGETAAALLRQFGGATFIKWAGDARLNPDARNLADLLLTGAAATVRDPRRLTERVKQLEDPSVEVQRAALAAIRDGGVDAVPPLLASLADPARKAGHELAEQAIIELGPEAVPPLAAALQASDAALKIRVIKLLAALDVRSSTLYLLAPYLADNSPPEVRAAAGEAIQRLMGIKPTRADAIQLLTQETSEALAGHRVIPPDTGETVTIWRWDDKEHRLTREFYPPNRALAFVAARLAGDLFELDPRSLQSRRLYLMSLLESAVYRAGLDAPLPTGPGSDVQQGGRLGIDAINDALSQSIATGHTPAAKAAARLLEDSGNASLLTRNGANLSPLVLALRSDDPRLRFQAAETIMHFDPIAPFPGSSYLTDAVAYFASAAGKHRIAIGYPTAERAQLLAGLANAAGYDPHTASNGRDLLFTATESPDTEIILVSGRLGRPDAFDVVEQLRHDPRTALIPICILGELDDFDALTRKFEDQPRLFVALRPESPQEMRQVLDRAAQLAGDSLPPVKLREQQAVTALDWLAEMAAAPAQVFDVRRCEPVIERALYRPATSEHAARVMALLGTHSSQLALVDLASIATHPLAARQAAAEAFAKSVARFGLRLAPSEVIRQYDRYNQSASLDKPTQQLLANVLDAIEKPTKSQ